MEAGQLGEALIPIYCAGRLALAKRRIEDAGAAAGAVLVGDGNVDVGADEGDVEHNSDKSDQSVAGKAAQHEQRQQRVQSSSARDALDGSQAGGDGQVVVVERCEEVGVDGEDDGAAAELDAAEEPLQEFEAEA